MRRRSFAPFVSAILAVPPMLAAAAAPASLDDALVVRVGDRSGRAEFVTGRNGVAPVPARSGGALTAADAFVADRGALFGVEDAGSQLTLQRVATDTLGFTTSTYEQVHDGVPVFAGVLRVHQNPRGEVYAANGEFREVPDKLNVFPTLDEERAVAIARANVLAVAPAVESIGLTIVDPGWYGDLSRGVHLAYHVVLAEPDRAFRRALFIDAHTGEVLDSWSMIHEIEDREVYDEGMSGSLPGAPARFEGDPPTGDFDTDAAFDYLGDTYDYYANAFGRDSIDGAGMTMIATVDTATTSCPNAYWNGFQTVYCGGVVTDDVVAHELTHGVTEFSAGLIYQNQSGQLNESFSDVFGELVDLYNSGSEIAGATTGTPWVAHTTGGGADSPNPARSASCSNGGNGYADGFRWLVGEDSAAFGDAIRDMWDPTCKGDPDRNNSPLHVCSLGDAGGVHSGSGIPNHAFAILVDGDSFNGFNVTGIGTIKAGAVWYRALTTYLTTGSDFQDAYWALNQAAADLVGTNPNDPRTGLPSAGAFTAFDAQQVDLALRGVEMDQVGVCGQTTDVLVADPAPVCASPAVLFDEDFESGAPGWTVSNTGPTPYDWQLTSAMLPRLRAGTVMFVPNMPPAPLGDESGTHSLTSPTVVIPGGAVYPVLEFTHFIETEPRWDGCNVKISVNGGAWQVLPPSAFYYNGYNDYLFATGQGSTNPEEGQPAFSGLGNVWGTSLAYLGDIAAPGDSVRVRFDLGKDGNTGAVGWYVDDVRIIDCAAVADCNNNGIPDNVDALSAGQPGIAWSRPPSLGSGYFSDPDGPGGTFVRALHASFMYPTRVEAVRVWGGYYPGDHLPPANVTLVIHSEDAGSSYLPGGAVYAEPGISVTRTPTGRFAFGVSEYQFELHPAAPVDLPAGLYWFEVYDDTTGDSDGFFLIGSEYTQSVLNSVYSNSAPGAGWTPAGNYHLAMEVVSDLDGTVCVPDLTTTGAGSSDPGYGVPDGSITAADIAYYVNLWVPGDLCADLTTTGAGSSDPGYGVPDGSITAADIAYYVNLWVAGCP